MSMVTDVTKKIILAGLGTIDEQNEEIKDLLRRGSTVLGINAVDNEELLYNGNRDEIMRRREEREKEDNTINLGNGRSLRFTGEKDDEGKVTRRNIEYEKKPLNTSKEISFEAKKEEDGTKTVSISSASGIEGSTPKAMGEQKAVNKEEGGASDDQD